MLSMMLLVLGSAAITQSIGVHPVLGAFVSAILIGEVGRPILLRVHRDQGRPDHDGAARRDVHRDRGGGEQGIGGAAGRITTEGGSDDVRGA